jgi:hypothetical protein
LSNRINAQIVRDVTFEQAATAGQTVFILTTTPSVNSVIKMYINGIRISNTAYGYKTTSAGTSPSSTPTTFIGYNPTSNGSYILVAGDRIQMDYYY